MSLPSQPVSPGHVEICRYACDNCREPFPLRSGWRPWRLPRASDLVPSDRSIGGLLEFTVSLPIALAFLAVAAPIEFLSPSCPMCGYGTIKRKATP